ncbi:MAG: hypothetical protein ACREJD_15270 [Phycisphaerales bacterium]
MRCIAIAGCAAALSIASVAAQAAWGLQFEVSPNGTSWGSAIAINPGGSVYFRVGAYFDLGTQVTTTNGIGSAIVFGRFTGQHKIAGAITGDSLTEIVRQAPSGGVTYTAVSLTPSGFLIGTTAATSFASYVPVELGPYAENPMPYMALLKGKITLSSDPTPRTLTVTNNLFGSGSSAGLRFYSDAQLTPIESGPPVDSPNHTDITATILVPNSGCSSPAIQSITGTGAVAPSQTAMITVSATNGIFFEWLKNGVSLNGDGRITGTATATMTISEPTPADAASYRMRVYNACGTPKVSDAFVLTVICGGDLNRDAMVDDADFVTFAQAYELLACPASPTPCPADMNVDGFVDDLDFVVFAAQYDQLVCP